MDTNERSRQDTTSRMLEYALWYWRKGLSVIPLCWPVQHQAMGTDDSDDTRHEGDSGDACHASDAAGANDAAGASDAAAASELSLVRAAAAATSTTSADVVGVAAVAYPADASSDEGWVCGCGGCAAALGDEGRAGEGVGRRPLVDVEALPERIDEAQLRAWWRIWPEANVGILLAPSGLLLVDVEGEEARHEAQALGMYLTRIASSPRGFHYYYKRPEGCPLVRRSWQINGGAIGILTDGYVVAPPSRHPSGERYLWRGDRPTIVPPVWIEELAGQPSGHLYDALRDSSPAGSDVGSLAIPSSGVELLLSQEPPEPWSMAESLLPPTTALSEELQIWDALGWITADHIEVRSQVGQILHRWDRHGQGRGRGRLLWERWSECSSKLPLAAAAQERLWQSFGVEDAPGINERTASSLERLSVLARQSRSGVLLVGKAAEWGCSRDDCRRADVASPSLAVSAAPSVSEPGDDPESSVASGREPIRMILVCQDRPHREALLGGLKEAGIGAIGFGCDEAARAFLRQHGADAVVWRWCAEEDVALAEPLTEGEEEQLLALGELQAQMPRLRWLFLLPEERLSTFEGQLCDGASVCVSDAQPLEEQIDAIAALFYAIERLSLGPLSLHRSSRQLSMELDAVDLSEPEFAILTALLSHHGKVVTFDDLATLLFHPDVLSRYSNVNENIRQSICRIRNKLEQIGAERSWITNVRGRGYRLSLPVHSLP